MTTTTATPVELLTELRSIIDQREALADQDRQLGARKREIELTLMGVANSTGLESFTGGGIRVGFSDKFRAVYNPEKWSDVVRWAVETNNTQIIQRRTSDAKIIDLHDSGVALPEGLTLESYRDISVRRM